MPPFVRTSSERPIDSAISSSGSTVRQGVNGEDHHPNRRRSPDRIWLHLVPPRHQRPPRQFHDRPNSMGGVRWDSGSGGNRAIVRCEETDADGLAWKAGGAELE